MQEDDEGGGEGLALGRTLALSDGIFAIAMTLLAFQIQPPDLHGSEIHHLASVLGALGNRYFVYVLSFAVIGTLWLAHHRIFRNVRRADEALMSLNVLFLMAVAALPFPSAVMGLYGSQRTAVVLYASSMAVAGSLLGALLLVARRRRLLTPEATQEGIVASLWNSAATVAVFTLSIPVALAAPTVAPYTWLVVIPLRLVRGKVSRRAAPD
ncbi:MAG: potassium channel family protein [Actinomycetota bacterium]|jgi:uncharacterized membrane protein|nr:potassium channel family protein [Actinomycetota bacterium]